jgi:hypothetical protein
VTRKTLRIQRNKTTIVAQETWSRETSSIIEKEIKKEGKHKYSIINVRKRKVHNYKSNDKVKNTEKHDNGHDRDRIYHQRIRKLQHNSKVL